MSEPEDPDLEGQASEDQDFESKAPEEAVDFWADPDHDDTGLDLARSIAKATASSSLNAPRRKPGRKRAPQGHGGRPKKSGAHPDERDPQTLDVPLGRLVTDSGWALDLQVHCVFGPWPAIVGEEAAQHCTPITFDDGKPSVQTRSEEQTSEL